MDLKSRIDALVNLGKYITKNSDEFKAVKVQARLHNAWFTDQNIEFALNALTEYVLDEEILQKWVSRYEFHSSKKVGLILAGNIPLVGFHDIMCCFVAGHQVILKPSSKDSILTLHLIEKLNAGNLIEVVDRLTGMDAVIATGSNQSAKQFERYFNKYPHIIRRNRSAVAVLAKGCTREDIVNLGKDVFTYFGLGCRNVSKIYIEEGFDKMQLMEVLHDEYKYLINHSKYKNNYDYNHAIYLMNGDNFLASGAVLFREHKDIVSRIACLHYEEFSDLATVSRVLRESSDQIQCISGNVKLEGLKVLPLGHCQKPKIDDYADGVDTMDFLSKISKT